MIPFLGDAAIYDSEELKSNDVVDGAEVASQSLVVSSVSEGSEEFRQAHLDGYESNLDCLLCNAYTLLDGISYGSEYRP